MRLEDRSVPSATHLLGVGTDAGSPPRVRVLDRTGSAVFDFHAYDLAFAGGVRVAVGDVTGDAVDDLITAPGPSGGPHVKVYDGVTGNVAREFFAYGAAFTGGVNVAAGDTNNDGYADIITAAASAGGPHVKVFDGKTGELTREFFAYDALFTGGVTLAAGDVNGDGRADIVTGPGFGGGPHVRVFSGASGKLLVEFFAYSDAFRGGVFVAAGDATDDGRAEIVTGPGVTGGPHLRVFSGATGAGLSEFFADFGSGGTTGGARVAAGFTNDDGKLDVIAASGPGGGDRLQSFDAMSGVLVEQASAFPTPTATGGVFVCCPPLPASNVILDFNAAALRAIATNKTNPPRASRNLAILHVAVADAVATVEAQGNPALLVDVAAAAAARDVLASVYPNQTAVFDRILNGCLAASPDGDGEDQSVEIGKAAAATILANRANDGANDTSSYATNPTPGHWQPTPPAFANPLEPQWGNVDLFSPGTAAQFQPPAPPALDSDEYAAAFNEVKDLGSATSTTRTAEQTQIARFWADGAGTITPPGHWNRIAADQARRARLNTAVTARLFYQLNVALADAAIVSWSTKYSDDFWRPVTAIRRADEDGNASTAEDTAWASLIATPPFPSYTSGHSTFSGAGATILDNYFGNATAFRTFSDDLVDVSRGFASFQAAADEAGQSRIYGGIHFQFDNLAGKAVGRELGQFVVANT